MNYKETLFFIGKCLTISLEEKNRNEIEEQLKKLEINWEAVVKVSTQHYVFPALYCNLKKVGFLTYLPDDLVEYMKHLTDLNRERNQQIIKQAKEINQLLLENNITPIFLKGTGNLLEGLYDDIAERMVGDIDIIVAKKDFKKSVKTLKGINYSTKNEVYMDFHWHYPKMTKAGSIAALEVHNKILKKPYTEFLDYETLKKDAFTINNYTVASYENQFLISVLQKQINDNLYFSKTIAIRTVYDSFLLSHKIKSNTRVINNKKIQKYLNNYKCCISEILNFPSCIAYQKNKASKKYLNSYLKTLYKSKKEFLKIKILKKYHKIKDKIKILQYSFTDKEYSTYTFRRLKTIRFYLKQLGFKKPNP